MHQKQIIQSKKRTYVLNYSHFTMTSRIKVSGPHRRKDKINTNDETSIILEIVDDYCNNSSLHGIGYLRAKDKNILEKAWWLIMLCLSIATCIVLISQTWIKWKNNPVIISFEREQTPLWEIPFPAVTICPVNKVQSFDYNYTHNFRTNLSELDFNEKEIFWDISLVCNLDDNLYDDVFALCSDNYTFTNESAVNNIRSVAPPLDETIFHVYWQNKIIEKEQFFFAHLTEEGHCFTFNSFSQEDMYTEELNHDIVYINHSIKNEGWTLEDGYSKKVPMKTHPRRSAKDGQKSGLSVLLITVPTQNDMICGTGISGYKLILHNPAEPPKTTQQYFLVPLSQKMVFMVRPELTRTVKSVQSLSIQGRKCFFSNEKSLRFFKIYTQNNCRTECFANVTNHYCGCVPFYMPRDNKTLICGFPKIKCLRDAEEAMLDLESKTDFSHMSEANRTQMQMIEKIFAACNCLPACTTLDYTAETSQTESHIIESMMESGVYDNRMTWEEKALLQWGHQISASRVDIFFKEPQFLALQRSELFGQTDFFANCGGLLGLFMGFSLLSGLEIIYFLTIRLWLKWRNRQKDE